MRLAGDLNDIKASDKLTVCCRTRFHGVGGGYPGERRTKWVSAPAHAIQGRSEGAESATDRHEEIIPVSSVCSHTALAHHTSAVIQARQAEDVKDEMRDVIVCGHIFALPSSLHKNMRCERKAPRARARKNSWMTRMAEHPKCILPQRGIPSHKTSAEQPTMVTRVLRPVIQS